MPLKHDILIVDDDEPILRLLEHALTTYEDCFTVHTAKSGAAALEILKREDIAVVVTDVCMPGMDGFELIMKATRLNRGARFIVMSAHDSEEARGRASRSGVLQFVPKPFELDAFIDTLLDALTPRSGFQASGLHLLHLSDVLQLLHVAQASQVVKLSTELHPRGAVYLQEGQVVHATFGKLSGEQAFFEIMAIEGGVIEAEELSGAVPKSIDRSLMNLVMESMRLKDEREEARKRRRQAHGPVVVGEQPELPAEAAEADFYRLVDDGFQAYRASDLNSARQHWEQALQLRPEDRRLLFNLKRLEEKERASN